MSALKAKDGTAIEVVSKLKTALRRFLDELDAIELSSTSRETEKFRAGESTHLKQENNSPPDTQGFTMPEPNPSSSGHKKKATLWVTPDALQHFKRRLEEHKSVCSEMDEELLHFATHYRIVGGDANVIAGCDALRAAMLTAVTSVDRTLHSAPNNRSVSMSQTMRSYESFSGALTTFHGSLYKQRHAFYFRSVRQWQERLYRGYPSMRGYSWQTQMEECLSYVHDDFFPDLEHAMRDVKSELIAFGKTSLPTFLSDEKERERTELLDEKEKATTRYTFITTIATFFSSVTATTLQFSLPQSSSTLGSLINFFWLLSLVFSVSSGISSLFGLMWRKSSIYDKERPPRIIELWLDKFPMVFLIVSAFAFIIGLNLFTYSSTQSHYVSFTTNILTGAHIFCMIIALMWFILQLQPESIWAHGVNLVITLIAWTFLPITYPYKLFKENPYLRRNVFWALGLDHRVAILNEALWSSVTLKKAPNQPSPHVLARITRAFLIDTILTTFMRAVRTCLRCVEWYLKRFVHREESNGDADVGVKGPALGSAPPEQQSEYRFRESLARVFGNSRLNDVVMWKVISCTGGLVILEEELRSSLNDLLWGYPKLIEELYKTILPVLAQSKMRNLENQKMWLSRFEGPAQATNSGFSPPDNSRSAPGNIPGPSNRTENIQMPLPTGFTNTFPAGQQHSAQGLINTSPRGLSPVLATVIEDTHEVIDSGGESMVVSGVLEGENVQAPMVHDTVDHARPASGKPEASPKSASVPQIPPFTLHET